MSVTQFTGFLSLEMQLKTKGILLPYAANAS